MDKITGSILIGGRSSRMGGGIKSLKKFNNKTILDRVVERSIKQVSSLAINSNNKDKKIEKYLIPIFSDILEGHLGPLAGIHASLIWSTKNNPDHQWVVTFAGDTPFFPNNIVKKLYNKATMENNKIVLARSFGRNHPVFGIWHISLLEDLEKSINNKIRKIDQWAKNHFFKVLSFDNYEYDPFFNVNNHKDLIKAAEIETQFFNK